MICQDYSAGIFRTLILAISIMSTASAQIPRYNSFSAATATVYLDLDGEVVSGTGWNWDSTIHAQPANLPTTVITEVFNRIAEDYRIFKLNITTDSQVYARAPIDKRIRVIMTPTSNWYGIAGGVSFVNSFVWGDGTPSWVFLDQLQNNPKYIAEATSHEIGHTLGLQHQSDYSSSCALVSEYGQGTGTGEIGWAPIMGEGYYQNQTTWRNGPSIIGCTEIQDDIDIIANGLNDIGFKADDYGNTLTTAYNIPVNAGPNFQVGGLISSGADLDVFKIVMVRSGRLKIQGIPINVGAGNSGANVDIQISLVRANGDTIGRYNPKTLLNAQFDTTLSAGTYYAVVDGVGNAYTKNYGSLGYYYLYGTLTLDPVVITRITLSGFSERNQHSFKWTVDGGADLTNGMLETSDDGLSFLPVTSSVITPLIKGFRYNPVREGRKYYRISASSADQTYYSNVVVLENNVAAVRATALLSSVIRGTATVTVGGDHAYQLFDETGRMMQQGKLVSGTNHIAINGFKKGLMLLKVYNAKERSVFKLINQ
jgi:hypothetical protein